MGAFETHLLHLVTNVLTAIGYPGLFLLMAIEGFGIPIPSEVTMPFSGYLTTSPGGNVFSVPGAIIVGAAGEVFGSLVAFSIGFSGGRAVIDRYGHVFHLRAEEMERAETWFKRYGDWVIIVARLLPVVRGIISLPAGVVRMSVYRFALYSTVGSAVWCVLLVLFGHALGTHWKQVGNDVHQYNYVLIIIVALAVVAFVVREFLGRRASIRRQVGSAEAD